MKKLLLSIAIIFTAGASAMAQSSVRIAPELGVTAVTMLQKVNDYTYDSRYQAGFRIGGVAEIPVGNKFYFQPGLGLMFNNGTHSTFNYNYSTEAGIPGSYHDDRYYHIISLNAPLYFVYKTGRYFDDPHFFVGLGVFLNANVGGRFVQDYNTVLNGNDRIAHYDRAAYIGYTYTKDDITVWDLGPTATIGFELPIGVYVRGYYNIGLLNQAPGNKDGDMWHNMGGGISIGYMIDLKPRQTWGWK